MENKHDRYKKYKHIKQKIYLIPLEALWYKTETNTKSDQVW
jgi:hypothetical protein